MWSCLEYVEVVLFAYQSLDEGLCCRKSMTLDQVMDQGWCGDDTVGDVWTEVGVCTGGIDILVKIV